MKKILAIILFLVMNLKPNTTSATVLEYLVRQPKIKIAKPPLIILLHGVGSNEHDLFSYADKFPDQFLVISARAPYTLGPGSFAWYQVDFSTGKPVINKEQEEQSRKTIIAFIADLKKQMVFDHEQVFLGGFSQGAIMSYGAGLTRPDLVRGIFALSGRLLEEVKPHIDTKKLDNLEVFISHGTNDEILGIHYARESAAYLKKLKVHTTYKEYPQSHTISGAMLGDLVKWLKDLTTPVNIKN